MSISTKTGDSGMTSLIGGRRVSKDNIRVEAYGTIDELSAEIGLLITYCTDPADISFLTQIQHDLFLVAGYLATDPVKGSKDKVQCSKAAVQIQAIHLLNDQTTNLEALVPPFKGFILPGGCRAAAVCHVCRTVCRRAERCIVMLHNAEPSAGDEQVMQYINRLSDYFFLLARRLNADAGVEEPLV